MKLKHLLGALPLIAIGAQAQSLKPNIVLINADDLGFGDVSCNGMTRIQTPNVDRLAKEGLRMTGAHTTSATSTPSRYSMLTGTYAWRTPGTGVAEGDAAMIIRPETPTVADMLKRNGYRTAAVGKWHLGLGSEKGKQDWNGVIDPSLDSIGFDYSFIMAATGDRVPCVYIEQGAVVGLDPNDPIEVSYKAPFEGEPLGKTNPELLRLHPSHGHDQAIVDSISRIGYMRGGKSALWKDELIAETITEKALDFVRENADTTFFLYFATNDIHVPRVPHWKFKGKSGMGDRGDAILQFDHSIGQVLDLLDSLGIADNTLVILTSDNGPVVDDGYKDRAWELLGDHKPWGEMRGSKYSVYQAGTCVPFLVRWGDKIKAGQVSSAGFSNVDIFASLAAAVGDKTQATEAADSENYLNVLTGKDKRGRRVIVEDGYTRSVVVDGWKYIRPSKGMKVAWQTGHETGCNPEPQLFNLSKDPKETTNIAAQNPKKVAELAKILEEVEKRK